MKLGKKYKLQLNISKNVPDRPNNASTLCVNATLYRAGRCHE